MNNLDERINKLPVSAYLLIARIDSINGRWHGGLRLSPQLLGRLKRSVLATSTGASTRIEGSKLSDEEVEDLMLGLTISSMVKRDAQEVRGYYEVLQLIFESYNDMDFSENLILHLHNQLLKYSEKDIRHKGVYKHLENSVEMKDHSGNVLGIVFETTPAFKTPMAMENLVNWTKQSLASNEKHPLVVISGFTVEFLKIHPFVDGNGRLSRLLTNLLLLKTGYAFVPYVSHEKLVEETKSKYYIALRKSQTSFGTDNETIEVWTEYFLRTVLDQSEQALALLNVEDIEKILSPQQLKVWKYLSRVDEATPGVISYNTGVPRPTVSQALERLIDLKRVEKVGQGRTTRYRII